MTKKESLTNTLSDLKKVRENSDKLAKLNKRLEKGNTNIENIANKSGVTHWMPYPDAPI